MSLPTDGFKAAQTGLVDMGDISFYDHTYTPAFTLADLTGFKGAFSEMVLNVTWKQLQAAEDGALATFAIDNAIAQVSAYNIANGTDLGIKLRVWGGFQAPDWAQTINGPAITITGKNSVDPEFYGNQTIGRFWTADYINAWASLQNTLAARYDGNPLIRGISQTAGGTASDEPFVPLMRDAPLTAGSSTLIDQIAQLQAGGYNDAAQMLTLRAAIADYAQWSTTPLDYTMNTFNLFDSGPTVADANFSLAVLQQARNSTHLVQAGNHALRNPLYDYDLAVYGQLAGDAALNPAVAPNSFQTASPETFFPTFADWQAAIANGVALAAGNIELWNYPPPFGFPNALSPDEVQALAAMLAAGSPPPTGSAPDDGSALGFIAPAFATGGPGGVAFTGTDAVLLASANPQATYNVTLTSTRGGRLGISDLTGVVIGSASGPSISLSGSLAAVNTVLAHLSDTLPSGSDVIHIVATDSSGNTAVRDVGVQIAPPAPAAAIPTPGLLVANQSFAMGGGNAHMVNQGQLGSLDTAARLGNNGILVLGGVQGALSVAGNLDVTGNTALLAALSPGAYSSASLTVGGTLEVESGAHAFFTGSVAANTITVDLGGTIHAAGVLTARNGTISNNGTIEAIADQTVGQQRLNVASALTGSGTLIVDAGATLRLGGSVVSTQTIEFAAPSVAQFANGPYSPSTLVLADPMTMLGTINGFTFADSLVLVGVAITSAIYDSPTERLNINGPGGPSFKLPGITDLTPSFTLNGSTITFVAPASPAPPVLPGAAAPSTLWAAINTDVLVPGVVILTPQTATPSTDTVVTVKLTAPGGRLQAGNDNDHTTVTGHNTSVLTLIGTLDQVERSLQTLTYRAVGASDTITIDVTDYAGTTLSAAAIAVWTGAGGFTWTGAGDNTFTNPGNWTNSIVPPGTTPAPPGGSNVATFGPGNQTVSGDGAVGQFSVTGKTTLTGQVTAQGIGGTALVVDSGGALMLAGGAQFTAQQQATVGGWGLGLLIAMGGAMELSGPSTQNALVIGDQAGSNGTVLNLEQITANGLVVVGGAGTGTLELLGVAASLSDGGADIGQSAGSTGSVIVNGGEWMTAGQLTVGDAGVGTLLVNGLYRGTTGQATAFNATVGAQAGGQGAVTLDGGLLQVANVYAASSTLTVGASGDGSIVLENGSEVAVGAAQGTITANNGLLVVGGNPGGNGLIRVGSYSSLLVYGDSVVGDGGVGVVTVGAGSDSNALFATAGTLTVGTAGLVTLGGTDAVLRASVFENAGTISGSGTLSGLTGGNGTMALARIDNDGAIEASGGDLLLYGSVGGSGQLSVGDNATLTLQASVESGQVLLFGHNGRVVLNDPNAFHGTIAGFGPDDVLELASSSATSALWGSGVLTVVTPTGAFHFTLAGDYVPDSFTVQSDGLGGTNVAGGRGDVHMLTFDGLHYDFQAVGAFVAVRSTAPGTPWQVQIETAGVHGVASVTTELAVAFGDAVVTFALGRPISLHVDGAADTTLHSGALGGIPGGTLTQLAANAYQLSWSSGQSVIVSYHGDYIDWGVALAPHDGPGSVQGLLGSHSGPGTDFQLPDGTVLTHPLSNEEIVGFFADAWRVDHDASHAASHWDHHAIL